MSIVLFITTLTISTSSTQCQHMEFMHALYMYTIYYQAFNDTAETLTKHYLETNKAEKLTKLKYQMHCKTVNYYKL